jgi:acid phosphatase (class B)
MARWSVSLVSLLVPTAFLACAAPVAEVAEAADGTLIEDGSRFTMRCAMGAESVDVVIVRREDAFDVTARAGAELVFEARQQRPSLNARIEDGATSVVRELIDWNPAALETVPVDAPTTLEMDLDGTKALHFRDASKTIALACNFSEAALVRFTSLEVASAIDLAGVKTVGFDIDDTLSFTTSAFVRGFATGGLPNPDDVLFWSQTNACDRGCPAGTITLPDGTTRLLPEAAPSTPKSRALAQIALHKSLGHRVYAITARPDIHGDTLRDHMVNELGIARDDVFFEPDIDQPGNPKGKTDRIEALDLDVFYGDSDSDITDAARAFAGAGAQHKVVRGVRFLRSPHSSNRKAGKLNKYHPGYYGEAMLADSYY